MLLTIEHQYDGKLAVNAHPFSTAEIDSVQMVGSESLSERSGASRPYESTAWLAIRGKDPHQEITIFLTPQLRERLIEALSNPTLA